jgi:formylglycine-generating enzyme required for sulfatase activity
LAQVTGNDNTYSINAKPSVGKDSIFTETTQNLNLVMVRVEGGHFKMGTEYNEVDRDRDEIVHSVTISSFYIGQSEITIQQYLIFANATNSRYPEWLEPGNSYNVNSSSPDKDYYRAKGMSPDSLNYPVTGISWKDAVAFCDWLSDETGRVYRLPTEAEWEFAACGGNKSKGYQYAGSDSIKAVAWYYDNSSNMAHPVKLLQPNELGLYDMSGNVWEWCSDWYGEYSKEPQINPKGPLNGKYRVDRGGAWSTFAERCRPTYRLDDGPDLRDFNLGFRIVCEQD